MFALVLVLGLGLAGFAVYMAQDRFSQYQQTLEAQRAALANNVPLKPVVVMNRAIRYGERLRKEDVRIVAWPENAIPEGAFTEPEKLFHQDDRVLRAVLRAMEKDEAILAMKVTEPGEDAGVSSRLAPGMRAFAIRVDVSTGVSGFLRPGDLIDIYWSGDSLGRDVTKLILEGVRLIAIDQSADQDKSQPTVARTVTVEISPQGVGILAQAQSSGALSLSLRGAEDNGTVETVEVDQNQLLGIQEQAPVAQVDEKVCTIRTRKGGEVVTIPIPCTQ
jgi:pilus assembly protein CpaB